MRKIKDDKPCNKKRMGLLVFSILVLIMLSSCDMAVDKPLFKVEPLAYADTALEPHISAQTLQYHHGKHYAGYVKTANRLTSKSRFKGKTFEKVIALTRDKPKEADIFNQVGQAWNHTFFFKSLTPEGGGLPQGRLAEMIDHDFGSFKNFRSEFVATAKELFGSGWVWLVLDKKELKIVSTLNGDTPAAHNMQALLVVDVWEHAYYLDYQNRRIAYVETVLDHLANWQFAASMLEQYLPEDG